MTLNSSRNSAIAAFIVALFYLLCYASAYEYAECPDVAQVQNAYWNHPVPCAGGVYAHGSLHLKWPDAPFSNDTVEVQSVSLVLRIKSTGAYMTIQVWNGHAWSFVSGGRIDFLGDYVYDLTNMPGPYADGSYRIKIANDGPGGLEIEHLELNIDYESNLKELTVLVRNCETNFRIKDAEVTVNGETVETGNDGEAEFTLPKNQYYEIEVGGEDYEKKYSGIYLDDGYDLEVCTYKIERPAVEVRDLEVEDDVITFYLENTGNVEETIQYNVKVNDDIIAEGYVTLDKGDEEEIVGSYDFEPGRHRVRVRAEVSGYADSDSTTYCVTGETENYRCSGKNVVREIIKSGCVSYWEMVEQCDEACSEGVCVAYGEYPGQAEGTCGIEITSLNYADNVVASEIGTFGVRVENNGETSRTVELKLYVDGKFKDKLGLRIASGKSADANFQFRLAAGSRLVRIDAVACGYVSDTVSEIINVKARPTITPSEPDEEPEVPVSPPLPSETAQGFYIRITPNEFSAAPCEGVAFKVTVHSSQEEKYNVLVTGVQADLLRYPSTVTVWGLDEFYVFIKAPKEEGVYPIKVKVWLGSEATESNVKLVVGTGAGTSAGQGTDALTGFVTYAQSGWVTYAFIGIVMAVVFIVLFMRFYMQEQEYDFASLEYNQNVRQASVGE